MGKPSAVIHTHLPAKGLRSTLYTPVIQKDVGDPGTDLECRLWVPDGDGPFPVLVMIHGGGFGNGEPAQWDGWGRELAKQGFVIFSTRYRRKRGTEGGSFPTYIKDSLACIKWLRAHRNEYGADTENLALVGSSAGAAIALWITLLGSDPAYIPEYSPYKDEPVSIKACVSYYPAWKWDGGEEAVTAFLREHPKKTAAPVILIHGTSDTTVPKSDSDDLHILLEKSGVDHTYLEYEDFPHAYAYGFPGRENLLTLADVFPLLQPLMPLGNLRFTTSVPDDKANPGFHLIRDPEKGNRVVIY